MIRKPDASEAVMPMRRHHGKNPTCPIKSAIMPTSGSLMANNSAVPSDITINDEVTTKSGCYKSRPAIVASIGRTNHASARAWRMTTKAHEHRSKHQGGPRPWSVS
jgi:hypothetical protein